MRNLGLRIKGLCGRVVYYPESFTEHGKIKTLTGDIMDETAPFEAGKPEMRQYRFYFLQKNQIVGESSDICEVTVHP